MRVLGYVARMRRLLEAVPNFSEGRDRAVLDEIHSAVQAHARVLDVHADGDHNRSVFTCVGEPEPLVEGLAAGVQVAVRRIDLRRHHGVHPRVGAADVCRSSASGPAIRRRMRLRSRWASASAHSASRSWATPSWAAASGRRITGRGGWSGLAARLEAGQVTPLFGPPRLHPTAGAVLLAVRDPLVAFNVDLATDDVEVARRIAAPCARAPAACPGYRRWACWRPAGRRCR